MNNIDEMISNSLNSNMPPISVLADAKVAMGDNSRAKCPNPLWFKLSTALTALLLVCVVSLSSVVIWGDTEEMLPLGENESFQHLVGGESSQSGDMDAGVEY